MKDPVLFSRMPYEGSVLLLEPFYGGSHKQLIDTLQQQVPGCSLYTMSAKKWHWRARTAALYFSQTVPSSLNYKVLFSSSVLNLAELAALRPDLAKLKKVLYFHENQLVYPVRKQQQRDFQYGYNQILSCLVADVVVFNSHFNMTSFLDNINVFLKLMPDYRPKQVADKIRPKCRVVYFPVQFPCNIVHYTGEDHRGYAGRKNLKFRNQISRDYEGPSLGKNDNVISGEEKLTAQLPCGDGILRQEKMQESTEPFDGEQQYHDSGQKLNTKSNSNYDENKDSIEKSPTLDSQHERLQTLQGKRMRVDESGISSQDDNLLQESEHQTLCMELPDVVGTAKDVTLCPMSTTRGLQVLGRPLHIVWPHRWEHDKDPVCFFNTLSQLQEEELNFRLSVLGETYTDVPEVFSRARESLKNHIDNWGYLPSKQAYYDVLQTADVVLSTAQHEFFGVAMLEAVSLGCYPLCPNRLVYPEIFPKECLYNTTLQLLKKLRGFCKYPPAAREAELNLDLAKYSWEALENTYRDLLTTGSTT